MDKEQIVREMIGELSELLRSGEGLLISPEGDKLMVAFKDANQQMGWDYREHVIPFLASRSKGEEK